MDVGRACSGRDQHDIATALGAVCSPGEFVPGSQDAGSGRLHRQPVGQVWIVTCTCTQASW